MCEFFDIPIQTDVLLTFPDTAACQPPPLLALPSVLVQKLHRVQMVCRCASLQELPSPLVQKHASERQPPYITLLGVFHVPRPSAVPRSATGFLSPRGDPAWSRVIATGPMVEGVGLRVNR